MTVSLKPVSHGSGRHRHADPRDRLHDLSSSSDEDVLAVRPPRRHLVDVHRVGVAGGVVELPDLGRAHRRVLGDRVHPQSAVHAVPPCRALGSPPPCRAAPRPARRRSTSTSSRAAPAGGVTVSAGSGAMAGSCRNCGGVVGSGASAGTTRNSMTWPGVVGSATSKSSPGTPPPNGSSGPTLPST
jgi:hypothetical protein